ncbi:hypothetical protein Pmani_030710 [Petrolisthes manimaculis]|uniref:Uncharacterized protein n=1 Tax=Petrolisthes manimaculis TaxID=1843537 RepID=A0AAE1NV38_9EUCA|nr:hypothetical protein Pmani_032929 [Petrolisthes manimaculis]KAK4296844.1 hypothetical protein Pmani_030710 [Petrolisthes manimaculis]
MHCQDNVCDAECSSADQFKRVLDRFLKSVPDQPKMPHYNMRALSNSIPDQLALMRADGNYITVSSISWSPSYSRAFHWRRRRAVKN